MEGKFTKFFYMSVQKSGMMSSKLPALLFLTTVLLLSSVIAMLPVANAVTRNTFNDEHITARFGKK
ncbi:MAG: hypothetical protein AUI92_02160 [Thaumarchaeota archaeon 13_1_40CM_3_38_6]|nr:MAG: hypothetical protein AUI92_02160 [Thaumarchaeota archaeon 13_1_40CM_3_38_6]